MLSYIVLLIVYVVMKVCFDVVFVFNVVNLLFLFVLWVWGILVVLYMDGFEWCCLKWGGWGKVYYCWVEGFGVCMVDVIIVDVFGIVDYYWYQFDVFSELICYGVLFLDDVEIDGICVFGFELGGYYFVVVCFEFENYVCEIVEGYVVLIVVKFFVVVGFVFYVVDYIVVIDVFVVVDECICFFGVVYDQDFFDVLYYYVFIYLYGYFVGGMNFLFL